MSSLDKRQQSVPHRSRWFKRLAPVIMLLVGVVVAVALMQSGPSAKREPPPRQARLVEIQPLVIGNARTRINAMATVVPAESVTLQPQVGGEIVSVSDDLEPGGLFRAGDELLRIDPRDYELAILQRESEVAQAQSTLRLEQGQQSIAKREFELLGESLQTDDRDLVLRKPQLESVRAQLALAKASLEKASLDLQRSQVRTPFNAIVESKEVDVGARVTTANTLATLVGTDACWLEVSVPVRDLQWIGIPRGSDVMGSVVRISNPVAWGEEGWREGRVIRLAGDLEKEGRMARLIVEVDDPFTLKPENSGKPVLLMNSYVSVEIEGRQLDQVATIARTHLRDGDRLWIMGVDDALEIRKVDIVFRSHDQVLVADGVKAGERLVVTDLAAPVAGMPLRSKADDSASAQIRTEAGK
ncbi:MAG: efflux RND transporter periplasmic adaptor subunit [Gammaproteobacteria bacterium]|nr:efflux RND transporter periplasmic adaptor subunit [Gammaproteobacteria bacterium]